MIAIKEIMDRDFRKVSSLDSVESALKAMEKIESGYLLIEEKGRIKGAVTSHELAGYPSSRLILDCPIKPITAISEQISLDRALNALKEKKTDFLLVTNKRGVPVGAVSREIIIFFLYQGLKKSNTEKEEYISELKKAEKSLKEFSGGLEEKVKERTAELSVLYEVSNAISYTLDYQTLLKLIMESLFKITDYDICASLLLDADTANITLRPAYPESAGFAEETKRRLVGSVTALTGEAVQEKHISSVLIPPSPDANPGEKRRFDRIRSFFNVPFMVRGRTAGMINVSSCRENAFSEKDIKVIYTITNQAANAIERLQAVIAAEKSKMASIVENMSEGVIMIDGRDEIAVLNPRAKEMLGFGAGKEATSNIVHENMQKTGLVAAVNECKEKKQVIVKEIITPEKESVILRCEISPVKSGGDIIGIVIILRDVTSEKKVDMMKSEFISTVSHELRTPLTSIRESVSQVFEGMLGTVNEKQKKNLTIGLRNIDRLARLINNLLDISRLDAGKMELALESVNLALIVEGVAATFAPLLEKKGLEFKTVFPDEAPLAYADRDKIVQVLTNLVSNAVKFTEKGTISVSVTETETQVVCAVADSGPGIAKEDMGRLFGKFQQIHRVEGSGEKGTGLGLAISKGIIEAHKGNIRVESRLGSGSVFSFTLPKQAGNEIFRQHLYKAVPMWKMFSVFLLRLDDMKKIEGERGKDFAGELMNNILRAARTAVQHIGLAEMTGRGRLAVLVNATGEKGAEKWRAVTQAVKQTILDTQGDLEAGFSTGSVVFPVDGSTPEALISAGEARLVPEKTGRLNKRLLVVDDDAVVVKTLSKALKQAGYTCIDTAGDGAGALASIKAHKPDLILLDLRLPDMSGYEVIGRLKNDAQTNDIPILFMSGFDIDMARIQNQFRKTSILSISKPLDLKTIKLFVNCLL